MKVALLMVLLILLAFVGGIRLLDVGYLADDWIIMTHVHRHGNAGSWTEPWLETRGANFHRPLFTGLYALERTCFGADPFYGHIHHLLWHVTTAVLLFFLILQLGGSASGAFLGALLFAWNPYHAVSLGWLASRTGTVAATLTLAVAVSWLRHVRSGGWLPRGIAVLAATAAALTKESGYLAFLIPPAIELVWRRPRLPLRSWVQRLWPFFVAGVGLLVLRRIALGTLGGGYGRPDGLLAGGELARRSWEAFEDACARVAMGVPPESARALLGSDDGSQPWLSYLGAALFAAIILGSLRWVRGRTPSTSDPLSVGPGRGRAVLTMVVFLLPQLLLLLLAAGATLSPLNCQRWYGAMIFVAGGVGLIFRPRGWFVIGVAGSLVVLYAASAWQSQEFVLRGAQLAKDIRVKVAAQLTEVPEDCDSIFVTGLPENYEGLPLYWWGFETVFGPPFEDRRLTTRPIYPVHRNLRLDQEPWVEHPPIEALVYLAGQRPFQIDLKLREDGVRATGRDYGSIPRSVVRQQLKRVFPGPQLEVTQTAPAGAELDWNSGSLDFLVPAQGQARTDFFIFVPGKDVRVRFPMTADPELCELWNHVRDFAFSRGAKTRVFLLPVGMSNKQNRLGKIIQIECAPHRPRARWVR